MEPLSFQMRLSIMDDTLTIHRMSPFFETEEAINEFITSVKIECVVCSVPVKNSDYLKDLYLEGASLIYTVNMH